jgi:hypothetical protein
MRKPRPPHQARRVHGPAAAFAGYKNLASSIARSSSFFILFQQPQSLHLRNARCSLFMRIRPFCLESYPFPPGSPDGHAAVEKTRQRGAGQLQPESTIAPSSLGVLSSCDADPLTCPPRIGRVTSSTASRPSRNLPRRRTITAPHCSALQRLRGRGTRPALVAARWPVAEMPHGDAAWLLPGFAPGAAGG